LIALTAYSASLGGRPVLHDINLAVGPGEFVALCGPNGAGKTTLLRAMAGLLPGGTPKPRKLAFVEQGARCAWGMSIAQVVALGRIPHGDHNDAPIEQALADTGLTDLRDRRIDQVSGGQARRAMLARALATNPQCLLLDEPVADLDPAAAHQIMALLARFAAGGGSVVAVLHALDLCARYATRMVVLNDGHICADTSPHEAMPHAAHAFGLDLGIDTMPRLLPPAHTG
jgi:iron complex transport system ATP-binding protein